METEETLERGTIETQVELMKNFVADTEDISVAEVYKDSDYSGTNFAAIAITPHYLTVLDSYR